VLSTLNGITELVDKLYSPFDQDVSITPAEGKTFPKDSLDLAKILALPGVHATSWTIEENVLLQSGEQQAVATLKGVEPPYLLMSSMADNMYEGEPKLHGDNGPLVILGAALKDELRIPVDDGVLRPLLISAPVRGRKLLRYKEQAFEQERVAVSGAFTINMEFDQQYAVAPIALLDSLLHYGGAVNALEIKAVAGAGIEDLSDAVRTVAGDRFMVKSRYEKNALMYRTNATEKWFTFAVLAFIGLIGAFNIIASLTLMMIEKQRDMRTMTSMGAAHSFIRWVFFAEGMLIVTVGTLTGLLVGLVICLVQQYTGVVGLENSVVESYPVKVLGSDIAMIFCAVILIGVLATWVSLRGLGQRYLSAERV
jgi:ABC-type lipoprotein release transport system permease subunit